MSAFFCCVLGHMNAQRQKRNKKLKLGYQIIEQFFILFLLNLLKIKVWRMFYVTKLVLKPVTEFREPMIVY